MKKSIVLYSVSFLFLWMMTACKQEKSVKKPLINSAANKLVRYAKGFDIQYDNGIKKLIIKAPYPKSKEVFEYIISQKKHQKKEQKLQNTIFVPIDKIVVTSTTHIPMIELLGKENALIGFPHAKYISSEKIRKRIDNGHIKELGKEASINTEILLDIQPELVVGFSMSKINKTYNTIEQAGIPVIFNGDWLEETPLGRAEWIKFFGVLFDKEQKADSIFNVIETNYLRAKKIAKKATHQPTVLSGAIMSKDIWNLPAGKSFVAQFLNDANLNYLWKNTNGKGSLSLSFESVFDQGKEADFWIAPGYFSSKKQLLKSNQHYAKFKAFKNDNIYSPTIKKGKTGGAIYFELAPTRPDLVLKDMIKITHPELLPNYKLTFFEKLK